MLNEGAWYKKTWMVFVVDPLIWGVELAPQIKVNLVLVANAIAKYEPISTLVSAADRDLAKSLLNLHTSTFSIELAECKLSVTLRCWVPMNMVIRYL